MNVGIDLGVHLGIDVVIDIGVGVGIDVGLCHKWVITFLNVRVQKPCTTILNRQDYSRKAGIQVKFFSRVFSSTNRVTIDSSSSKI